LFAVRAYLNFKGESFFGIFDAVFRCCCRISGYIVFKRKLINTKNLKFYGWGQQAEILTYLKNGSKKVYEAPISYKGRTYEEGKKINVYAMAPVVFAIIWTRLRILFFKV
jgi:hypothetical protein